MERDDFAPLDGSLKEGKTTMYKGSNQKRG
jgi:hypothetical protein